MFKNPPCVNQNPIYTEFHQFFIYYMSSRPNKVLITNYTGQNISQNIAVTFFKVYYISTPMLSNLSTLSVNPFLIQFPTSRLSFFTQSSIHHSYLTSLSVTSTTFHLLHIGTARLYNPTQCVPMYVLFHSNQ